MHHVGLAVEDLDGALDTYERLFGARLEHRSRVEEQGVEAASIRVGESRLELLGALGEDTPVGRFLAKRGPGMHHVAYEVDDVRAALAHLADAGAELIDESPRRGMFGLEVAFVHPDSVHGVLSEVVCSWLTIAYGSSSASQAARSSAASSTPHTADELESALDSTGAGKPVVVLDTEDGPLHVVVAARRVLQADRPRRPRRVRLRLGCVS